MDVVNFAKVPRRINLFLIKIKYTLSEKEKKKTIHIIIGFPEKTLKD